MTSLPADAASRTHAPRRVYSAQAYDAFLAHDLKAGQPERDAESTSSCAFPFVPFEATLKNGTIGAATTVAA